MGADGSWITELPYTVPTILAAVIEDDRATFAPPKYFGLSFTSSSALRQQSVIFQSAIFQFLIVQSYD